LPTLLLGYQIKVLIKKIVTIVGFFGSIVTLLVGLIYFNGYCYVEKNCPIITTDSLKFEVIYQYSRPCVQDNSLWFKEGDLLQSDDYYKVWFRPYPDPKNYLLSILPTEDNKFVYIFQVDNAERIERLFPVEHSANTNPVDVNIPYYLPDKKLGNNIGDKHIYFLTFREPNKKLDTLYEKILNSRKELSETVPTVNQLQTQLIDTVQAAWQKEGWLNTSVPIMNFKHREKSLHVKVKYSYRSIEDSDFQTLPNHAVLYSGDQYKIRFTPREDSYVYVFQVTTNNQQQKEVYRLFPCFGNEKRTNNTNPVRANVTYYLPDENKHWFLDDQVSQKKIYFLAFKTNIAREAQYEDIDRVCEHSAQLVPQAILPFESEPHLLQQNDEKFINILTFEHEDRKNSLGAIYQPEKE